MSLKWRLALSLGLLLVGLAWAIAWIGRYASDLYFQEVNQTLNASLSMYVVDRLDLIEDGTVNHTALKQLADQAMTVNPSVEVYLLDTEGNIVAHAMPEDTILHERVPLEPIQTFMDRRSDALVLGVDPRSDTHKAFSASPILHGENLQGYLYVVLGGRRFDEVRETFLGTFIGRLATGSLIVVFLLGGVAGLYSLHRTTRPLAALEVAIDDYTASGFTETAGIDRVPENTLEVKNLKTQVTRLTRQLKSQFAQIELNDKLRRELLANVSHDLRTPLASMQGYVETLIIKEATLTEEERRGYLETVYQRVRQLNQMVGSLFELAKLESGALTPELERFSIAELLNDVIQEFQLVAEQQQVAMVLQGLEQHSESLVIGDISLIQRVLENLISNALRYTPRGGEIQVALMERDTGLSIDVKDTGCGIDPDLLPRLFERHASEAAGEDSAGLGLAIVKRILELHDSEIHVTSTSGEGTCFTFELDRVAA